jgi:hypothetical protein
MSRTPNDPLYSGSGSTSGSTSGADSFGVTGTGAGQSASTGAYGSTSGSGLGGNVSDLGSTGGSQQGVADRLNSAKDAAGEKLGQAKDMAGEKLGQAKEKATQLKSTLADKLEAGASSLRRQGQPGDTLGLAGEGATGAAASNPQLQKLASTGADALQASAEFLRNGDLKSSIEAQVRTNPGRTLLIALGVGYALGKVIRGNDSSSSSSRRY